MTQVAPNNGNSLQHDKAGPEKPVGVSGCGIMGRYPIISLLLFVAIGIGSGIALSFWNGDEKDIALQWIGLIGYVNHRLKQEEYMCNLSIFLILSAHLTYHFHFVFHIISF